MIASMAQTDNFPQHRTIVGIPPGGSFYNSSSPLPSQSHSSIASFANSVGGGEYRNSDVLSVGKSSSRWQVPGSSPDLHISSRWPSNSMESLGHASPALDTICAAYSELFDGSIRGTDGQQPQFMDGSGHYSASSVASMLPGGSPGLLGRTVSSSLGSPLVSTSPQLCQGWNSTVDHGNLGLTVDPSKGGLALQGLGASATTQSLARFSPNPGFAERAARFSAFGNGQQYSPSFPVSENENAGRSPSFENDSGKRAKASASASRNELGPAKCSTEGPGRNSVPASNASEGRGAERGREDRNGKGELKASSSKPFATSGCSQVDKDERDKGRNADDVERDSSDSDASDGSRGEQETSCADQVAVDLGRTTSIGKKRKNYSSADETAKDASSPSSKEYKGSGGPLKRCKDGDRAVDKEEQKSKAEWSGSENSGLSNSPAPKDSAKAVEQPKLDYIHVRARRGQATDSHSLAERVRREKISERMKYLQDLVPGCSKVTGKAVMLDEIINYVQSIQRQVEFLSMKLAAVTPRPDFNIDSVLSKQLQIGNGYGPSNMVEHAETNLPFAHIQSQPPLQMQHGLPHTLDFQPAVDMNFRRVNGNALPLPRTPMEAFDVGLSQASNLWDGDLQSVVQMGFGQGMQGSGLSGLQCDLPPGHMKMEL